MTQPQDIDLDNLAPTTHTVGITFDDEGNPRSGFIIVGRDSEQFRAETERQRVAGMVRGAKKNSRIDTATEEGARQLDLLIRENERALAVAVTVGWFGFSKGGAPAEFSKAALESVFKARPTWADQVIAELGVQSNFLPKSQQTSANLPATNSA